MAATVVLLSLHGATVSTSPTDVTGGNLRFKYGTGASPDNDTADANDPIPIPAAGTNYSYIKNLRLSATVTPANSITNVKFYTDGSNGFGTGVGLVGKIVLVGSYINPQTQGTAQLAGMTDVFTYTSGSPLTVTNVTMNNPSTGQFGDIVTLQMTVASTASPGTTPSETLTFSFDES